MVSSSPRLVTGDGQPWALPLAHPGLRARCLATAGALPAARAAAEQGARVRSTPEPFYPEPQTNSLCLRCLTRCKDLLSVTSLPRARPQVLFYAETYRVLTVWQTLSVPLKAMRLSAGLHPSCHDSLAAFLSASGGGDPKQAAEAARLPGVSLRAQLRLLARARLFRQALACLLALESGMSELAPLTALPAFRSAAAHSVPSGFLSPASRGSGEGLLSPTGTSHCCWQCQLPWSPTDITWDSWTPHLLSCACDLGLYHRITYGRGCLYAICLTSLSYSCGFQANYLTKILLHGQGWSCPAAGPPLPAPCCGCPPGHSNTTTHFRVAAPHSWPAPQVHSSLLKRLLHSLNYEQRCVGISMKGSPCDVWQGGQQMTRRSRRRWTGMHQCNWRRLHHPLL